MTWLKNVVGVLRFRSKLERFLRVGHRAYDHIGMKPSGEGDRIFNGANDDASGTVSVIELARAFASV